MTDSTSLRKDKNETAHSPIEWGQNLMGDELGMTTLKL